MNQLVYLLLFFLSRNIELLSETKEDFSYIL